MPRTVPKSDHEVELQAGVVKAAIKESGAKSGEMLMVPIAAIQVIDGFNVRITGTKEWTAGIEDLTNSIIQEGFYRDKPLTVYVGKDDEGANTFWLTDGHRRFEALTQAIARGADIQTVPVIVKPAGTSLEDLTVAMAKTGEPLQPYEMAILCKRMVSYGREPDEIAKRLGITRRYVDDLLYLIGAPAKIRNLVVDGKLSATLAIKQLRSNPKTAVKTLTATAEKSAKDGKARITNRDLPKPAAGPAIPSARGIITEAFDFKARAGDSVKLDDIQLFQAICGGSWYSLTGKSGEVEIVEDIDIRVAVKRKPKEAVMEGADDL
jgi:ParB family transcriptional regulator, chromosome partitioning protein